MVYDKEGKIIIEFGFFFIIVKFKELVEVDGLVESFYGWWFCNFLW